MILSLLCVIGLGYAAPTEDLVDPSTWSKFKIPYAGKLYSGYLPIDDDGKKQFHYFAFPAFSLAGPLKATFPLVLWLNGGPGCSSLYGAMVENGPFVADQGTNNFKQNLFTWLNFANMFYLESPAGVGFSFGNTTTNDKLAAKDNLQAVIQFFKKFPEYQSIDFYIAGESWAGIYIPTLANEIIDYNNGVSESERIRLKGLMIGNGCTHPSECTDLGFNFPVHYYKFIHDHNFISQSLNDKIVAMSSDCQYSTKQECLEIYGEVMDQVNADDELYFNPYNVYGECTQLPHYLRQEGSSLKQRRFQQHPLQQDNAVPECSESEALFLYLNNEAFRKALHIRDDAPYWNDCSNIDYTKEPGYTYHLYPKILKNNIRVLKFSGDVDSIVPITGTLYWINELQKELSKIYEYLDLQTIEQWRAWYKPGEKGEEPQNAGNVWEIDGLLFVSVRNAGHMVPLDQPEAASIMASHFIFELPLPSDIL